MSNEDDWVYKMKMIYFDASRGVSGDMFVGALIDLGADFEKIKRDVYSLGLFIDVKAEVVFHHGIRATKFSVLDRKSQKPADDFHEGHSPHDHRNLNDIRSMINASPLDKKIKDSVLSVFKLIAEAEAHVHGTTEEEVHFHEVGAVDSIADIVAAVSAFHYFNAVGGASPVNVGGGTVKCRHGELPVPAPAVVRLLEDMPAFSDGTKTELSTPTGVALLKFFCDKFGDMPCMSIEASGYGAGSKQLDKPNLFRATLGTEFKNS